MSTVRHRPKRRLRSELPQLAVVMSLPLALYLAFPKGAVGFTPALPKVRTKAVSAVVFLDSERKSKLLASARASWQSDASSRRAVRANLLSCDFSKADFRIGTTLRPVARERFASVTDYEIDPVPGGVAAAAPAVLKKASAVSSSPIFPKEEFLKLKER